MRAPNCRAQRGYTLLELSVSMIIALFLMAGLVTVVMHTRNASTTQSQLEQLHESERIALTILANVIQETGYFPYPTSDTSSVFATGQTVTSANGSIQFTQSGQSMAGMPNTAAPGDAIAVRFVAPTADTSGVIQNTIVNCAGGVNTDTTNPHTYTNVFQIWTVSGTTYLQCLLTDVNNNTGLTSTKTVNLVPGLYDMQVLYGIATNGQDNNVTMYVPAATMNANPTYWTEVTSVKIRLYFQTPQYGFSGGQVNSAATSSAVASGTQYIERVIAIMNRA